MNTLQIVTTCNAEGWAETGRTMAESWSRYWPQTARLRVYAEGFEVPRIDRVEAASFPDWFEPWKAAHLRNPAACGRDPRRNRVKKRAYDYRQDCVKFSHKVAALTDPALDGQGLLVWMDADTLTHAPVDSGWLEAIFPRSPDSYMAWLDRASTYPECGFMIFRRDHPRHSAFMSALRYTYESDDVLRYRETHDSFVIQQVAAQCTRDGWFGPPHSLSGPIGRRSHHPFVVSRLGERLDHCKGGRKRLGRTPKHEVASRRRESYWR